MKKQLDGRAITLVIDEIGDKKKGKKTDYVARQYLESVGKVDNGIVSVNLFKLASKLPDAISSSIWVAFCCAAFWFTLVLSNPRDKLKRLPPCDYLNLSLPSYSSIATVPFWALFWAFISVPIPYQFLSKLVWNEV